MHKNAEASDSVCKKHARLVGLFMCACGCFDFKKITDLVAVNLAWIIFYKNFIFYL